MKILYVITVAERGGAQIHVLELLRSYSRRAEVHLAVGQRGFLTEEACRLGISVHLLEHLVHPIRPARDCLATLELIRLIRKLKPDLVHAHSSKAGQVGRLAARLTHTPAVYTAHGWAFADGVSLWRKVVSVPAERLATRWSKYVITVSEADRALAGRYGFPMDRMITVHNGVPDVSQRAHAGRDDAPPHIVMVARFAPPKDQALLLNALAGIDVPFRLSFVGDGKTLEQIRELAFQVGLADRVTFLGNRDDVAQILAGAQIFALTSNWEGFPLSILEAMRAGLPIIASDVGGVREAIAHDVTGYLVPRGDIDKLRYYLVKLLVNPGLREKLGREARKIYEQKFTVDFMLERVWHVYEAATR